MTGVSLQHNVFKKIQLGQNRVSTLGVGAWNTSHLHVRKVTGFWFVPESNAECQCSPIKPKRLGLRGLKTCLLSYALAQEARSSSGAPAGVTVIYGSEVSPFSMCNTK